MFTLNESGPGRRSLFERGFVQNLLNDNEFDVYEPNRLHFAYFGH